jgi:hypothetical protein
VGTVRRFQCMEAGRRNWNDGFGGGKRIHGRAAARTGRKLFHPLTECRFEAGLLVLFRKNSPLARRPHSPSWGFGRYNSSVAVLGGAPGPRAGVDNRWGPIAKERPKPARAWEQTLKMPRGLGKGTRFGVWAYQRGQREPGQTSQDCRKQENPETFTSLRCLIKET